MRRGWTDGETARGVDEEEAVVRPPTLVLRASREARREEAIEGRGEETVDMVVVIGGEVVV